LTTSKPRIFITMGDPAGIGPEIIVKSMARSEIMDLAVFAVIGDEAGIIAAAKKMSFQGELAVQKIDCLRQPEIILKEGVMNIIDPSPFLGKIKPGVPTKEGAQKALDCLAFAVKLMRDPSDKAPRAMVTAPICKETIAGVKPGFRGHTEYLAEAYSSNLVTMVMVGEDFSVVPVTRHIPLKDVAPKLNKQLILGTLLQVIENRNLICARKDPKIGVCALNPHAGEGGEIGREEIEIITPAVRSAKEKYENITLPMPADTLFYKAYRKEIDIVVAMYHDQGLAPFKMIHFDSGVNMTLGLAHIRTSPDHGTAFDIAGKGIANPESMAQAIKLAVRAIKAV